MEARKTYDPEKPEGLKAKFNRYTSRLKHQWSGKPVALEDINKIKLPVESSILYFFGEELSYFAARNQGGKWNVEGKKNHEGEYTSYVRVGTDLELPKALDLLAAQRPAGMREKTDKYWHPAYVARLIGHTFKKPEAPKPQPPQRPAKALKL